SETRNAAVKRTSVFFVVAGAKVNTFPVSANIFEIIFSHKFHSCPYYSDDQHEPQENFFRSID
ncbi:hypothetical protein, partial [Rikenella microfusus]|uniref:hypothetical protein n=1 Tax=Rikenella microfusus TaxID=28139 RepID=UPI002356899A